ncbi:MAG: HD domain-containing protein [Lachnospiraceae bacterium]|nr:HD domain-containing protein [Lachnospiraceae bacterium]MBQ5560521.1 HD domain-containing protein [Lachnospiraceae bacterium]MCR4803140.1 HD domain-containing protein [Lachnospiraceae bacterium]
MRWSENEKRQFDRHADSLKQDEMVQQMKNYVQHGNISTYEHCLHVAQISFIINRKLGLKCDEKALITGAMLHDFFLYDWHDKDKEEKWHQFHHAKTAADNAEKYMNINEKERAIIENHMWPMNLFHIPKTREEIVVSMADKYCSTKETIFYRKKGHVAK